MKAIRIVLLLLLLVFVAFYSKLQRLQSTAWIEPLAVAIYPINADGTIATSDYINSLSAQNFKSIELFFEQQWNEYSELSFAPIALELMPEVDQKAPTPPARGERLKTILWSLQLRFWAYQNSLPADKNTVNIFIQYQQYQPNKTLAHSLGLQKGLIGIVNGYANKSLQARNNVVIAHELLHTVGASDKYDLATGQPIYPDGYAEPEADYPQLNAEIMGGRIPLSKTESAMPQSLDQCVIGPKTAAEINWLSASQL